MAFHGWSSVTRFGQYRKSPAADRLQKVAKRNFVEAVATNVRLGSGSVVGHNKADSGSVAIIGTRR